MDGYVVAPFRDVDHPPELSRLARIRSEDYLVPPVSAVIEDDLLVGFGVDTSAQAPDLAGREGVDQPLRRVEWSALGSFSIIGAIGSCVPVTRDVFGGVLVLSGVLVGGVYVQQDQEQYRNEGQHRPQDFAMGSGRGLDSDRFAKVGQCLLLCF